MQRSNSEDPRTPASDPTSPRIIQSEESYSVEFGDIDFQVPSSVRTSKAQAKGEKPIIHILKRVSGQFKPNRLTCVMGPSGSGKTTLLNLIAGRQSEDSVPGSKLEGVVSLNGAIVQPTDERERFAFVMAHDALYATMTPRETFRFTLKLSSDVKLSDGEIEDKVNYLLQSLRLTSCADTVVGNLQIKGLSSGEKKRVSVGMEMIHDPQIFLLDEPTSGLDSHSASVLVDLLKKIAASGRTVVTSIHQPSSDIFQKFDDVCFMTHGEILYFGPVAEVPNYCASIGHPCPSDSNPSDHVMFLLQTLPADELSSLAERHRQSHPAIVPQPAGSVVLRERARKRYAGFGSQFWELGKREWINFFRDWPAFRARLRIAVILIAIISFVYWQVGKLSSNTYIDVSHIGSVTLLLVNSMFTNSQIQLLNFPMERPVFLKEYASGLYGVVPYFVSKTLVEMPVLWAQVCLSVCIGYFIMGLQGSYIGLAYSAFLVSIASASIALLIGSIADDARRALELAPIILVPQIFFSGFFVPMSEVPAVLRWGQYLCSLKYGINIAFISEFENYYPAGSTFLVNNDINTDLQWLYALLLVIITVGFRILAIIALKRRAKQLF